MVIRLPKKDGTDRPTADTPSAKFRLAVGDGAVLVDAKGVPVVEKTAAEIMAEIERERPDPMHQFSMLPQLPFHDFQADDNRRRERDRSEAIETARLAERARLQVRDDHEASKQGGKRKRRTWRDVAWTYMIEILNAGQYTSAKALFQALERKAGKGSPFDKGTGPNVEKLVVRETSTAVSCKTIQNLWAEIQACR